MSELATWQSHKRVRAGQIERIDAIYKEEGERPTSFRVHVKAADAHAGNVIKDVPYGVFARLISETGSTTGALGQMLMIYDGGYVSWFPKDAFEQGYTLLGEEDAGGRFIGLDRGEDTRT